MAWASYQVPPQGRGLMLLDLGDNFHTDEGIPLWEDGKEQAAEAVQFWSKQVDVQQTHSKGSEAVLQDQI